MTENTTKKALPHHSPLTTKVAMEFLFKQIDADPEYRRSWVANIAVRFQDAMGRIPVGVVTAETVHKASNEAAEAFISQMIYCTKPDDDDGYSPEGPIIVNATPKDINND